MNTEDTPIATVTSDAPRTSADALAMLATVFDFTVVAACGEPTCQVCAAVALAA